MRKRALALGFGGWSGLAAGCYEVPPMSLEGSIEVSGQELGDWVLDPGICLGGAYTGVDVSSRDGQHCIRFVDDPADGPQVIAYAPGTGEGFAFTEADCEHFYVRLDRVVDSQGLLYSHGGEIQVECSSEHGTMSGAVAFEGCW